jgi:hypothetical protein
VPACARSTFGLAASDDLLQLIDPLGCFRRRRKRA